MYIPQRNILGHRHNIESILMCYEMLLTHFSIFKEAKLYMRQFGHCHFNHVYIDTDFKYFMNLY